ncbi:Guanylate kinase [Armadillidium vulgare]|nr:Guanylate kinase [Armadillidium vulgare]
MSQRPVVVFCGPSGVGKSTLLRKLISEYENCFAFSVSHTTREPRKGEEDNVHYHFVPRDEMTKPLSEGTSSSNTRFLRGICTVLVEEP